jgi:hypothetical protein
MIETIIGIDCGKTGGVAINSKGKYIVHKMPESNKEISELLNYYKDISKTLLVVIEHVNIYPGDMEIKGTKEQRGKQFGRMVRVQKLLNQYEAIKTIMDISGINYVPAAPVTWQKYLNLRPNGWRDMSSDQRKKLYQEFAQAHFPTKVIRSVADSVCILIYAKRRLEFDPDFINTLPKQLTQKLFK